MGNYIKNDMRKYEEKADEIKKDLPPYAGRFLNDLYNSNKSSRTVYAYAMDLMVFFEYLKEKNEELREKRIRDIPVSVLDSFEYYDIQEYMTYLRQERKNNERTRARKLSSLRSFYAYLLNKAPHKERVHNNPAAVADMPKQTEPKVKAMTADEITMIINAIREGTAGFSRRQQAYAEKTYMRDLALFLLFLGTGIRITELVSIDLDVIDWKNNKITVIRKGGNEEDVLFDDNVKRALLDYIEYERNKDNENERALFLSMQNTRMTQRSIERVVKKYTNAVIYKDLTPHKLRSTFATRLLNEDAPLDMIRNALGHKGYGALKHYLRTDEGRQRRILAYTADWTGAGMADNACKNGDADAL